MYMCMKANLTHKLTNVPQFSTGTKCCSRDHQQCGQVDTSILVGLHLEPLAVPVYGLVPALIVTVTRLNKLVLVDATTQTKEIRNMILLVFQHLWMRKPNYNYCLYVHV